MDFRKIDLVLKSNTQAKKEVVEVAQTILERRSNA